MKNFGGLRDYPRMREVEVEVERLRHWLCSSHLLLRGSRQRGFMHRRSLDAIAAFASQTPAPPRRVSRFFRVWLPHKSPCRADHSAYFGLASFISPILSAVDVDQTKQSRERCQCRIQGENEISVNRNVENEVPFRLLRSLSSFALRPTHVALP